MMVVMVVLMLLMMMRMMMMIHCRKTKYVQNPHYKTFAYRFTSNIPNIKGKKLNVVPIHGMTVYGDQWYSLTLFNFNPRWI